MIGAPLKEFLIRSFYRAPEYLGAVSDVILKTEGGRRVASDSGQLREVVLVGANDVSQMLVPGPEGVYVVGVKFPEFDEKHYCAQGVIALLPSDLGL